ncbi:hypothetical protein KDL44_13655 [bacterium]|nr:hypothetical protein [bacterium]
MEFRLGMWDCRSCGHSFEPDQPVEIELADPSESIKRAKLITRDEPADSMPAMSGGLPGGRAPGRHKMPYPLGSRLACIAGQIVVILASHAYVVTHGEMAAWIGTGTILTRVAIQLLYAAVVSVGLIWREPPIKYLTLALQIPVFIMLVMMTIIRYGLVGQPDFTRHHFIPEMDGWYWAMLMLLHTALMFAIYAVIHRDLEARAISSGRA